MFTMCRCGLPVLDQVVAEAALSANTGRQSQWSVRSKTCIAYVVSQLTDWKQMRDVDVAI